MTDTDNTQEPSDTPQEEQAAPQSEEGAVPLRGKPQENLRNTKEPKLTKQKSKPITHVG